MSAPARDSLQVLCSPQYEERIEALGLILEAERKALLEADFAGLEELVQRKQALLEQMQLQLVQLRRVERTEPDDPRWHRIQQRLDHHRRINHQNGRLIAQAERHVRDALSLLRGDAPDAYNAHGHRSSSRDAHRPLGQA